MKNTETVPVRGQRRRCASKKQTISQRTVVNEIYGVIKDNNEDLLGDVRSEFRDSTRSLVGNRLTASFVVRRSKVSIEFESLVGTGSLWVITGITSSRSILLCTNLKRSQSFVRPCIKGLNVSAVKMINARREQQSANFGARCLHYHKALICRNLKGVRESGVGIS